MVDLATVPVDDLIQEVQNRLDRGEIGYEGLYSSNQLHFRALWHNLADTIHQINLENFDNLQVRKVVGRFWELAGTNDVFNPQVFALNTTLPGVERPQDHQKEWLDGSKS